jgi:hypothetical protein
MDKPTLDERCAELKARTQSANDKKLTTSTTPTSMKSPRGATPTLRPDPKPIEPVAPVEIRTTNLTRSLKPTTDPELLIHALNGPLFFRWLQGHAPLENSFAERIFDKVLLAFQSK